MHAAKIYVENYANGKKSQVDSTRHLHPPTANSTYQQFSAAVRLFAACTPAAPTSQRITVNGLYCTPTENLSRFCKIFAIFRINCFPVWNN